MKILQLVSDWKWTGPAQPMLVLAGGLRERGHRVELICPEAPAGANRSLWHEASLRGFDPIRPIEPFRSAWRAGDGERVRRLRGALLTDELGGPFDIVHCWHSRDHVLAARALRLGPRVMGRALGGERTRLVRSLSHADPIAAWPWNRWLFGAGCDGLVCVGEAVARQHRRLRRDRLLAFSTGAVEMAVGSIPRRSPQQVRAALGVPDSAPLIGIVARMQAHRRFDLLLAALAQLVRERPDVRLVVIGRGSRAEELVAAPARALGLEEQVVFAGYRVADYAEVLAAMDLFTFLVPGSDGTCRALLEAASLGLPLVGTRRGAIPEIISNGQTGVLVDETPESLAAAWRGLIADPERRRALGEAARRDAQVRFRPDRWAAWMERFYEEARAQPGAPDQCASDSLMPINSR